MAPQMPAVFALDVSIVRHMRRTRDVSWPTPSPSLKVWPSAPDPETEEWVCALLERQCPKCDLPLTLLVSSADLLFGWCNEHGSWIYQRGEGVIEWTTANQS